MSSGEERDDQLYFAMWRTDDGWRDGVECKFQWVVTGDATEFRDTIIDWAYESEQDNWEPRWEYEHSPKRPETLRPALRWIEYMNEGCGGQFVWFKATADRFINIWQDGAS